MPAALLCFIIFSQSAICFLSSSFGFGGRNEGRVLLSTFSNVLGPDDREDLWLEDAFCDGITEGLDSGSGSECKDDIDLVLWSSRIRESVPILSKPLAVRGAGGSCEISARRRRCPDPIVRSAVDLATTSAPWPRCDTLVSCRPSPESQDVGRSVGCFEWSRGVSRLSREPSATESSLREI